jgi:hypothetical protein
MPDELCWKCGLSWSTALDCLSEPRGTDNREMIETIIENCPVCKAELKKEVLIEKVL